jgi:hypothetical protein
MRSLFLCAILTGVLGSVSWAADVEVYAEVSCRTEIANPDTNRHDSSKLSIRGDASSAKSWIRFNLEEYDLSDIRGATLRLTMHEDKGTGTFDVSAVNDNYTTNIGWLEREITWNNAPGNDTASFTSLAAGAATLIGTVTLVEGNLAAGSQYFIDVTSAIQADTDGIVQFVLHNSSGLKNCSTHDHPSGEAYYPMLILTLPPAGADWPSPVNDATVGTSLSTLSWTLPEPNVPGTLISCDVYLGTEPNVLTMDKAILAPGVNSVAVNKANFPKYGELANTTTYYWWVDCHDASREPDLIPGEIWSFYTYDNLAPTVNAGDDQVTWLTNDPNTITLVGTADDDGQPSGTLTVAWTRTAGPATAVISSANQLSTLVSFVEPGDYTFTLTANDSELQTSDAVRVVVGAGPCDASHVFTGDLYNDADANQDCLVDLADFIELIASDWLSCTDTLTHCN